MQLSFDKNNCNLLSEKYVKFVSQQRILKAVFYVYIFAENCAKVGYRESTKFLRKITSRFELAESASSTVQVCSPNRERFENNESFAT